MRNKDLSKPGLLRPRPARWPVALLRVITQEGMLMLRAQRHRSQDMSRADALAHLPRYRNCSTVSPHVSCPNRPTYGVKQRRLKNESLRERLQG